MAHLPNGVVGDAYWSTFAWELLDELTEIGNRMAGQEGEAEGARVMRDGFERAGLEDPTITEFEITGWRRGRSELAVDATDGRGRVFDADYEVLALPGSPGEHVAAELIDVGAGLPDDFENAELDGKIALAGNLNPPDFGRAINRIEKFVRAREAGAAGFVYVNEAAEGGVPPTGAVGFTHPPGAIPAVGVSKEVGARIRRYLEAGPVTATIDLECHNETATCRNVEATIGPESGPELLVTGHVDAHDIADGARDNGAGSVLAAEVGRVLALADDRLEGGLDTRIRVVAFGGEETGLFGSTHWAETADLSDVAGQINLDGIGYSRDLRVGGVGLLDAFDAVESSATGAIGTDRVASPYTDHWPFVIQGVPSVTCRSDPGVEGQVVRYGGHEWGHTHADTLDKLDPRDFRDLAIPIAAAVAELAARETPPERHDEAAVRELLPDGLVEYLRVDDRWPW